MTALAVRSSRLLQRVAASLVAATLLVGAGAIPVGRSGSSALAAVEAPIMASGFRDDVVISGLSLPTSVKFAPNGDIFVAEKAGIIKRYTSLSDPLPDIVADLRTQVYNYWDKGLLGLDVDPQYPRRPYVYALFAYDAVIGGTAPLWGSPNTTSDPCPGAPNGPGPTEDGCTSSGRLLRLTVGPNGIATSQKVLVDDWCAQFPSHSIGTTIVGPDGYLYAGGGDGASFSTENRDYGQFGGTVINSNTGQPYTPRNPCGDPPGGIGGAMSLPTAQGGSLRAQDKRTTTDPTGLAGTIIRVDPDTGLAAPTNPSYAGGHDENDRRIIAFGLRNPYRFTFRPGTNELWLGDVGDTTWEEIDRIVSPTNPVRNFGWPCYEGVAKHPGWDALDANVCENLYAAGSSAVQSPYYSYRHSGGVFSGDPCPFGGGVISGISFYTGAAYPARLSNALFFTDYGRRCIWAMRAGTNGLPDTSRIETIEQNSGGAVDLEAGPGGDIFYADIEGGSVHRLVYTAGNQAPVIDATATPSSGPAPLKVDFDASATKDPDGNPMTFAWDLDADGSFDDGTGPTAQWTYAAGTWHPVVRVTDNHNAASTQGFTIVSGNTAPVPVIDTPAAGVLWSVGQTINFTGHATDDEDGTLGVSKLSWSLILHHCSGTAPTQCHEHFIQDFSGVAGGSFQAPEHDLPAYLELRLTATDNDGLNTTVVRNLQPRTVDLTFASSPAGLSVSVGTRNLTAPSTGKFIVNSTIYLFAPLSQVKDGLTYDWSSWSDGGGRSHTIHVPSSATTYTANYTGGTLPADAPNTCAGATTDSPAGSWNYNTLSSTSDIDWYRFTVPSKMWTIVTLGGLPSNYRLDLYSACGTLLASANKPGTKFEEISRELSAGTYRVRVKYVSDGVSTTVPYGLRFRTLTAGLRILSSSSWINGAGNLVVDGELINNTLVRYQLVQVTATYYDLANNTLGTQSAFAYIDVLRSRQRSPFRISAAKPAGFDHYTVDITYSQQTTNASITNLTVSSASVTSVPGPSFRGTFKNGNSFAISRVNSVVTLYDKWATVINTRSDSTSPVALAANATATYNSTFTDHYSSWSRGSVQLQATKT